MKHPIQGVTKSIVVAFFVIFPFLSHASVISPDIKEKVSINVSNMPMLQFFTEVENRSDYSFFYSDTVLKNVPNVSINVQDMAIDQLLREVFKGTNLIFELVGNKIAIKMARTDANVSGGGECYTAVFGISRK